MTQSQVQAAVARTTVRLFSPCRFVIRFIVSAVSTLAGLVSFSLVGPTLCRIAAIDPALETFYGALVVIWFGSLGRMWFLTLKDRGNTVAALDASGCPVLRSR